jgi:hypothetical protein
MDASLVQGRRCYGGYELVVWDLHCSPFGTVMNRMVDYFTTGGCGVKDLEQLLSNQEKCHPVK